MSTELALANDNDLVEAFGAGGLGEFASEVKFDYISIAAKNTDMVIEGSPSYVEGLKSGYFFNAKTKRVYGKKLKVIILDYHTMHKEHTKKPNGQKDKFVRVVPESEIKSFSFDQLKDYNKNGLPNGNILEELKVFYLVMPEFKEDGIVILTLSKGSFKHVRNWGNLLLRTSPVLPAHIWEVETALMGLGENSYFSIGTDDNTLVKDAGALPKDLIGDVKDAYELVKKYRASYSPKTEAAAGDQTVLTVNEDSGAIY